MDADSDVDADVGVDVVSIADEEADAVCTTADDGDGKAGVVPDVLPVR